MLTIAADWEPIICRAWTANRRPFGYPSARESSSHARFNIWVSKSMPRHVYQVWNLGTIRLIDVFRPAPKLLHSAQSRRGDLNLSTSRPRPLQATSICNSPLTPLSSLLLSISPLLNPFSPVPPPSFHFRLMVLLWSSTMPSPGNPSRLSRPLPSLKPNSWKLSNYILPRFLPPLNATGVFFIIATSWWGRVGVPVGYR